MFTAVQLSVGVSDWEGKQLEPVSATTTFSVGQQVYVTFRLATNQPGTVSGTFCGAGMLGANAPTDAQAVPADYRGGRGAFRLQSPWTSANIGPGVVTLQWNGTVAAVLPYTVVAG
jgi:hypothetical protein